MTPLPAYSAQESAASAPLPHTVADAGRRSARDRVTLLASALFVALAGIAAWLAGSQPLAVYMLGFWHYLLYGLAYRYGAVPLPVFKRDAVLMKSVALFALASAYLSVPLDFPSLALVATGFLINARAASVLGSDRTYYGHEVANLPLLRVTRFPYSVMSHPMLVGNMLAYGGTLLNAEFRAQWWPLACAHVGLNLGLLAMERYVTPLRLGTPGVADASAERAARPWSWPGLLGLSAAGAAIGVGAARATGSPPAALAALGATTVVYGYTLYRAYSVPAQPDDPRRPADSEKTA